MFKRGTVIGCLCLGLSLLAGGAPARAATSGSVTAPVDGVLYDDCRDVTAPYTFTVPAGTDDYDVDFDTIAPDGTSGPSDDAYSYYEDENPRTITGIASLQFCGSEMPGTYRLTPIGRYSDYEAHVSNAPITFNTVTFQMRQPQTKTRLTKTTVARGVYKLTAAVTDERPAGYFRTEDAHVHLEYYYRRKWHRVGGSRGVTDSRGKYTYRTGAYEATVKVRMVTSADDDSYTGSTSNTVTIR